MTGGIRKTVVCLSMGFSLTCSVLVYVIAAWSVVESNPLTATSLVVETLLAPWYVSPYLGTATLSLLSRSHLAFVRLRNDDVVRIIRVQAAHPRAFDAQRGPRDLAVREHAQLGRNRRHVPGGDLRRQQCPFRVSRPPSIAAASDPPASACSTFAVNRDTISATSFSPSSLDAFGARILAVDRVQRMRRIVRRGVLARRVRQRDPRRIASGGQAVQTDPAGFSARAMLVSYLAA